MATINFSDVIYVTLMQRGNVLASVKLSGVTSATAVLKALLNVVSKGMGMVTLTVRNSTQGWTHRQALLLK